MFLKFKMNREKKKLDQFVEKYGLNHEKTLKQSIKANDLINEYYRKHTK